MVKDVRLYIEGDTKQKGKGNSITLRQGFNEFFGKWAQKEKANVRFHSVLCSDRGSAVRIFLNDSDLYPKDFVVLLIDTEREKDIKEDAKVVLQRDFPNYNFKEIKESQCHFMVQSMESWFLADKEKLAECYDDKFNENALPKNAKVEEILKKDVLTGLKNATRETSNGKGEYGKGADSGRILGKIRPQKVRDAAPHCKILFDTISKEISK
jgi:hypothetical protein